MKKVFSDNPKQLGMQMVHGLYAQILHNINSDYPKNASEVSQCLLDSEGRYTHFENLTEFENVKELFEGTFFAIDTLFLYDNDLRLRLAKARFTCFVAHAQNPDYGHHVAAVGLAHCIEHGDIGGAKIFLPYIQEANHAWLEAQLLRTLVDNFQVDFDEGSDQMVKVTEYHLQMFHQLGLNVNLRFPYFDGQRTVEGMTIAFALIEYFEFFEMEEFELDNYNNILKLCVAHGVELAPYATIAKSRKNLLFTNFTD